MISFFRIFVDGKDSLDIDLMINLINMTAQFTKIKICTKYSGKIIMKIIAH